MGGAGQVSNSSIVLVDSDFVLLCLSGTSIPDIGHWINPNGTDITYDVNGQFEVIVGDNNNPGSLEVHIPSESDQIDEGVFTCAIPDDTGEIQYLYVGIYQHAVVGKYVLFVLKCGPYVCQEVQLST